MFDRFFHSGSKQADDIVERPAPPPASDGTGDTATVRRIVSKLEAMPPEQARFVAAAAYILARAANADLEISNGEMTAIEQELQAHESLDEPTAVLVAEMAKLQAKTVGGTEDFVVTREFKAISTESQRVGVLRACFAISAVSGTISAEENAVLKEIADELDIDDATLNAIRADYHEQLSSVQAIRRVAGRLRRDRRAEPPAGSSRRTRPGEVSSTTPIADATPDLGEQLGVVGDAAAELHRERGAAAGCRQVDDDPGLPGPIAQDRLERLHRADESIGWRSPANRTWRTASGPASSRRRRRTPQRRSAAALRRARPARRPRR